MKRLLLFLLLLACSSPAWANGAYVQSCYFSGSSASMTCGIGTNSAGNTIIGFFFMGAALGTAPTISDSRNGSIYGSPKIAYNATNVGWAAWMYEGDSIAAGSNTITIALAGNTNLMEGFFAEVSGLA